MFPNNVFCKNIEAHSPLITSLVLLFLGLGTIITYIVFINGKKKRCTHLITATVTNLKRSSDDSTTYSPVYNFWFNSVEYTLTTNFSRNSTLPKIGSQAELYINPETPIDFYLPSETNNIFILLMSIILICSAAILFIL